MPKENAPVIKNSDLKNLDEVRALYYETQSIQKGINEVIANCVPNGLTYDQLIMIAKGISRKTNVDFRSAMKASKVFTEEQINETPQYSSAEKKAREALSMLAMERFAGAQYLRNYKDTALSNAVLEGKVTPEEQKALRFSRDTMQLLLNSGLDEETEKENRRLINHMLGRDIDRTHMTAEEFNDARERQFAEVINAKLAKVASFDYDRFRGLSDRELVENWMEYNEAFTDIYVIRAEIGLFRQKNKYVNQELAERCLEIESREIEHYAIDSMRIRAITSPYYAGNSPYVFDKHSNAAFDDFNSYVNDKLDDDLPISRYMTEISNMQSYEPQYFKTQVCEDLNRKTVGADLNNVSYFTADGKPLTHMYAIFDAAKTTGVLAIPKDRPDLVTAYKFNPETRQPDVVELLPYLKVVEEITKGMPDLAAKWDEEDKMLRGTDFDKFFENSANFTYNIQIFKELVDKAPHTEEMKAAVISRLQRTVAAEHPTTEAKEFAEIIGMPVSEILSDKTIEERRQLTAQAVKKYTEYSFENRPFLPTGADKEAVMKRIGECEAFCDKFYGKKISDADIVGDLDKFLDFGNGMGKGFKDVLESCEKQGIEFTPEEMKKMQDLSEKVSTLGDHASIRLNYILTTQYRYGGFERLATFANNSAILQSISDNEVQRTANAALECKLSSLMNLGEQIGRAADPTGERVRQFIYDNNGKTIPGNDTIMLAEEVLKSGSAMIFFEGDPNPVVVRVKDADRVPPEFEKAEMTQELRRDISAAKLGKAMTEIGRNGDLTPEMKKMEQSIVGKEYELGLMAEGLENGMTNEVKFKQAMSEYLARLTVREMQKNLIQAGDKTNTAVPPEAIASFAETLFKDPITDKVIEDIRKEPNGFYNLKSEEVYKSLLKHKHEANRLEGEKKEAERAAKHAKAVTSAKTIAKNITFLRDMPAGNESELYGLTPEIKSAAKKAGKYGEFTYDRASIQSIAAALLIKEGKDLKTLFSPELQPERERAAKQAIKLLTDGNARELAHTLGNAMDTMYKELCGSIDNMKDLSVSDMIKPENAHLIQMSGILKDFTQEYDIARRYVEGDKKELDKYGTLQEQTDFPCKMLRAAVDPCSAYLNHEEEFTSGQINSQTVNHMIQDYMAYKMYGVVLNEWKSKPENAGKSVSEFFSYESAERAAYVNLAINNSKSLGKLLRALDGNQDLSNKVVGAILDDTFDKEMGLALTPQKDGSYKVEMNLKNGIKNLQDRPDFKIPDAIKMVENAQKKQEAPKAEKAQQMLV